jgi:uncharacterized membrane protein
MGSPAAFGRSRQRGASAVFVAISMVASMAALGMALDLGRLYFVHRELQVFADMAALDASRSAGGCLGRTDDPQGAAAGEAASSLQRNGGSLNYLTSGSVEIGRLVVNDGIRAFVPDSSVSADSVRVTLRRPIPSRLIPMMSGNSNGVLEVSAAAALRPIVSIDVGSGLLDVQPLAAVPFIPAGLGIVQPIGLFNPAGLATANVELGDLAVAANAGSVQDFLDTEITAPGLLDALATALGSGADAASRAMLEALANGADASRSVLPREVLGVPAGSTSDRALVNAGAVVTSVAQAADGDNLIEFTQALNLPPLISGSVAVRLIELARPAIGPPVVDPSGLPQTFASTAQAIMQANIGLGTQVLGTQVSLGLYARLAEASAGLVDLNCAQRGRPYAVVTVEADRGVGEIGVGEYANLRAPVLEGSPPEAVLVRLPTLGVSIVASGRAPLEGGREMMTFEGPFPAKPQYAGTDAGEALAQAIEDLARNVTIDTSPTFEMLGPEAQVVLRPVLDALRPQVVEAIRRANAPLIAPLLEQMGVNAGSARVQVRSVVAQQPEIFVR